jgi:hypothetical protein
VATEEFHLHTMPNPRPTVCASLAIPCADIVTTFALSVRFGINVAHAYPAGFFAALRMTGLGCADEHEKISGSVILNELKDPAARPRAQHAGFFAQNDEKRRAGPVGCPLAGNVARRRATYSQGLVMLLRLLCFLWPMSPPRILPASWERSK